MVKEDGRNDFKYREGFGKDENVFPNYVCMIGQVQYKCAKCSQAK